MDPEEMPAAGKKTIGGPGADENIGNGDMTAQEL